MTTTAAAAGTRRHTGTYLAEPRQVGLARAALAGWLGGCPQADEAVLVASDGALMRSRPGTTGSSLLTAEQLSHDVFVRPRAGAPRSDPLVVCREGGLDLGLF